MIKTLVTETPIKCPRCFDKFDPDCKGCKGTGLVTKIETVTEQESFPVAPAVESYSPWYHPYHNWFLSGVTNSTGTSIVSKTCDVCGGLAKWTLLVDGRDLYLQTVLLVLKPIIQQVNSPATSVVDLDRLR
jgi:hypothetical protein